MLFVLSLKMFSFCFYFRGTCNMRKTDEENTIPYFVPCKAYGLVSYKMTEVFGEGDLDGPFALEN